MRALLDTCTFLWVAADAPELSPAARGLVEDPTNEIFLSAVSAWEIAIKHAIGRLRLPEPPSTYVPDRRKRLSLQPLPLSEDEAVAVEKLPAAHRDPFDRMLVSQAITRGLTIVTPDKLITQYPVPTAW